MNGLPLDSYDSFVKYCEKIPSFHQKNSNGVVCWAGLHWLTLAILENLLIGLQRMNQTDREKESFIAMNLVNPGDRQEFSHKQNETLQIVQKIRGLEKHQFQNRNILGVDGKYYPAVFLVPSIDYSHHE
jgi:hypothetical protein